jgi:hypothetical protein
METHGNAIGNIAELSASTFVPLLHWLVQLWCW